MCALTDLPPNDQITGDDIILIIEAVEFYVANGRRPAPHQRQDYEAFTALSRRLRQLLGMHPASGPRWWLQSVLSLEREGFAAALSAKMFALLKQPDLTRRQFREEMGKAIRSCRDIQFYKTGEQVAPSITPCTSRRRCSCQLRSAK